MAKTYIKLWDSYDSYFEPLGAAEVGRLVLAMMKYKSSGVEPEFSGSEKFIWPAIKRDIDEDAEYTKKKAESGRTGGSVCKSSASNKSGANESKSKQNKAGYKTKDIGLRKKSSSSIKDTTTTNPIVDDYRKNIGDLSDRQEEELTSYTQIMGEDLVRTIIEKCSDLDGRTWAYVRKALDEAKCLECKTVEEYNRMCPIGGGRSKRVDRGTHSGNDFLKNAGTNRSTRMLKKQHSIAE